MGGKFSCVTGRIRKRDRDKFRQQEVEIRVKNSVESSQKTNHFPELSEHCNNIDAQNGHHNPENLPPLNVTAGNGVKHGATPMEERAREHCIRMYWDTKNEGTQLRPASGCTE
jgi:hypothetical protein